MPFTLYSGVPFPPVGQDNPTLTQGGTPQIEIPADSDSNNVATMLLAQYRKAADWSKWTNGSLSLRPLATPAVSGPGGFSTVVKAGVAGAGTMIPTSLSGTVSQPTNLPGLMVAKITTAGALGVAAYAMSTDNGATYSAPAVIPGGGVIVDATTGISLTFAGTFGVDDTYQFQCVDCPVAIGYAHGGASCASHWSSHDGTRGGIKEFVETWHDNYAPVSPAAAALLPGNSKWSTFGVSGAAITQTGTVSWDRNIDVGAPTASDSCSLYMTKSTLLTPGGSGGGGAVFETPITPTVVAGSSLFAGFTHGAGVPGNDVYGQGGSAPTAFCGFCVGVGAFPGGGAPPSTTQWGVVMRNGAAPITQLTPFAVGATPRYFRIEITQDPASPFAGKARFFIDGVLVAEIATTQNFGSPLFQAVTGAGVGGAIVGVGTVRLASHHGTRPVI